MKMQILAAAAAIALGLTMTTSAIASDYGRGHHRHFSGYAGPGWHPGWTGTWGRYGWGYSPFYAGYCRTYAYGW